MTLPRVPVRTTPGFGFSMVERALQECLARRQFGASDIQEVLSFFSCTETPQCVYCGTQEVQRWDHLVPVSRSGETVLGNMVPACSRCDDSKQDLPWEEWMRSDYQFSPRRRGVEDIASRAERIRAYIANFGYRPTALEDRLDSAERERLAVIRSRLREIRQEADSLIAAYRMRVENA